jgi:hypothetical protein
MELTYCRHCGGRAVYPTPSKQCTACEGYLCRRCRLERRQFGEFVNCPVKTPTSLELEE